MKQAYPWWLSSSSLWWVQVDCWNKQGTSWVGPSERLAKMMMKHESKLGQRLKGYVEAGQHSVYVC